MPENVCCVALPEIKDVVTVSILDPSAPGGKGSIKRIAWLPPSTRYFSAREFNAAHWGEWLR
jgi:hypothetical protein